MARYNPICENCKQTFKASRFDAKFCGVECRKQRHRRLQAMDKEAENVAGLLRTAMGIRERLIRVVDGDDKRMSWSACKQLELIDDAFRAAAVQIPPKVETVPSDRATLNAAPKRGAQRRYT